MTTQARAGVGARFQIGTGSPVTYTDIAELTAISGPEISAEQWEATSLESTGGYKEYVPGFLDGGTISITLMFINSAAQQAIRNYVDSINVLPFRLLLPTSPEAQADFTGYVTSWSQSAEPNAPMTAEVGIKISAAVNWAAVVAVYGGHNAVVFDGVNDAMTYNPANNVISMGIPVSSDGLTFAAKLTIPSTVTGTLFSIGAQVPSLDNAEFITIGIDSRFIIVNVRTQTAGAKGNYNGYSDAEAFTYGVEFSLQVVIDMSQAVDNNKVKIYINGAQIASTNDPITSFTGSNSLSWRTNGLWSQLMGLMAQATNATVNPSPVQAWTGATVKYLALKFTPDVVNAFYNGGVEQDLTTLSSSYPIVFGGDRVAANWNAGTNRGTGVAFHMNGGVA